jgi:hypothetical protein
MQINIKDYDREIHKVYKSLSVKNPFAYYIQQGFKKIEIRSRPTKFRGTLTICSSARPVIEKMVSGAVQCQVELYDCVKVSDLTPGQWDLTLLPTGEKEQYADHYGWMLRGVKPMVEIPVSGQLGIWDLCLNDGDLVEYPQVLQEYQDKEAEAKNKSKIEQDVIIGTGLIVTAAMIFIIVICLATYFIL